MTLSETGLDFRRIRTEMDREPFDRDPDYGWLRRVYLGTVTGLVPSGRLYAAWSDVDPAVVEHDIAWFEAVERGLESLGMFLVTGEGDANDLFACETREEKPA